MRHFSFLHRSMFGSLVMAAFLVSFQSPTQLPTLAVPSPGSLALYRILDGNAGIGLPVDVVTRPGEARMYIVDFSGSVRIWNAGELEPTPFLDLTATVFAGLSTGLRGMAFHPGYESNGLVYVSYDIMDQAGQVYFVIARMQRSAGNPDFVDANSLVEVLRELQPRPGHASSRLVFGPDGMLYAALGDGGIQQDPDCNGQNHSNLLGSMIRIDVDGGFPYAIPQDNPFLGDPNVRDECWVLGMRHPWRWSFDRWLGDLWISDVGQAAWEEVNFIPAGQGGVNLGWSVMEGPDCYVQTTCLPGALPCNDPGYTAAIHEYNHNAGDCSIIGGFVYRGIARPQDQGRYFYGDFCSKRVWSLRFDGQQVSDIQEHTSSMVSLNGGTLDTPVAFGQDPDGELLIMDFADNEIYRLVSDCHVVSYCEPLPNSLGAPATLTWSGAPKLGSMDLTFHVQGMPAGTIGHVFYSSNATQTPLGAGTLCVDTSAGYFRLPNFVANPLGRAHFKPDFTSPPLDSGPSHVLAGSQWFFQAWYRDTGAPLGSASNLTGGLQVFFGQ
ncbi:MAG: PQQ-dependent sugar dehydrogenase [Planctomycetota bacterium]|nr:PQQ-dependent sugar dehydrogenase [Planctomycetota bacterium]